MNQDLFENARWLVGAIARGLHAKCDANANETLARLAEHDLSAEAFHESEPKPQAVTRYYADTIAETMMHDPDLAAALASVDGHLHWMQAQSYTDELLGAGFSQNYGWCEIVGPNGFFAGNDFILGLLMLGPNRHYKDHYHPAPELYWPLTGPTQWKQGLGVFAEKQAGDVIFHPPFVHHATKTFATPMLAVWCWTSETHTGAKLA